MRSCCLIHGSQASCAPPVLVDPTPSKDHAQVLQLMAPSVPFYCLQLLGTLQGVIRAFCQCSYAYKNVIFAAGRAQLWGGPATAAGGHWEEGARAGTTEGGSPHGAAAGLPGVLQ